MISNKVRGTNSVFVAVTISVFLMLLGFASAVFAAPAITSVTPALGPTTGGTTVTITGTGFGSPQGAGSVTFAGAPATSYPTWTDTSITCTTPAGPAGPANVVVTDNGGILNTTLVGGFTYGVVTITSPVTPALGPIGGGTLVTINGANFGPPPGTGNVKFGGATAAITLWTDTQIKCTTAAHAVGLVDVVVTRNDGVSGTLSSGFTYGAVTITSVAPTSGPTNSQIQVTITGTNFGTVIGNVTFGGTAVALADYVSWIDTQIVCKNPLHTAGPVNVVVSRNDGGGSATLSSGFTYFAVTVNSVYLNGTTTPAYGPVGGGTLVEINGTNFGATQGVGFVNFGGIGAAGYTSWSDTKIVCTTPAHAAGAVDVLVVRNDFGFGTKTSGFAYGTVTVASVNPPAPPEGPIAGGTFVTINGLGFGALQGTGSVKLGTAGNYVAATFPVGSSWSDTQIVCKTAAHAAGLVDVVVTNNLGIVGTLAGGFTYFAVTITSVTPNFGTADGGTSVIIAGANFGAAPGSVTFGGTPATSYTLWGPTSITCVTPAHAVGAVDIVVTRTDAISGTLTGGFTYSSVTVTSVTPALGPIGGGTSIIIAGANFGATLGTVTLGGSPVTIAPASWSNTQIVGTTTAHAAGQVDVVVTRTDAISGTKVNGFAYFAVAITAVTPNVGTTAGGTSVIITGPAGPVAGANFGTTTGTVTFDGTPATITAWTDTSITCTTPAHAATPAPINVVVTRSDALSGTLAGGFTYGITFAAVNPVVPREGPIGGGTSVIITGTNFGATQGTGGVTFGGTAATITLWGPTSITCVTLAHAAGAVPVVVTRDGGTIIGTLANGFFYGVTITSVTPNVGTTAGGTFVTIVGVNFGTTPGNVTFGGAIAGAGTWADTQITCTTPVHLVPGPVDVVVTKIVGPPAIDGTLANGFTYGVTITSMVPNTGSIGGGTPVIITGANFGAVQGTGGVTFGGIPATITAWAGTSISCVTPAHAIGAVDVVVTRNDGVNGTSLASGFPASGFYYGVGITSVTPAVGPIGGGTAVTIVGTNFGATQGTGGVTFGGTAAPITSWINTQIVCTTPAHAAGAVNVVVTMNGGSVAGTLPNGFFYGVVITSVTPNVEPIAGGGPITIVGANFGPAPGTGGVTFGGIPAVILGWNVIPNQITCTAPAHAVGAVDVVVTRNDGLSGTSLASGFPASGFYYGVKITSVTPPVGPVAGGTVVHIVGENFGTSPGPFGGVQFSGIFGVVSATDYTWTNTSITCVTPPVTLPFGFNTAPAAVIVTRNDAVNGTLDPGFTYGVEITSVTPAVGPTGGGTPVTIAGSPFGDFATVGAGTVTFGGIPTTTVFNAVNWTNTQIMCTTPAHVAGPVAVVVTRHDGAAFGVAPAGFFYGVVVTSVTPNAGSEVPPLTPVTILGNNFGPAPGTGGVMFGSTPAVIGTWTNTVITCNAPAHAAGVVDVAVTRNDGLSGILASSFTYGVVITSVAPPGGPTAGGTIVTITGTNFGTTTGSVVFGGLLDPPASITSWTNTQIMCVTPPRGAAGPVDVVVTRGIDFVTGTKALGFLYGIVTITSVTPALGPVAGGTSVTIVGADFGTTSGGVTFGGAPASFSSWTNTQIVCVTPAHAAGPVDVVVTRYGGVVSSTPTPLSVFIYGAVTITSVMPSLGPVAGGTSVTIVGTNFGTPAGGVTFGGTAATIVNWTDTSITCATPAHAAGLVDVVVTRSDGAVPSLPLGFLYGAVTITSVTPSLGPVAGGTSVTIAGTNFGGPAGTVTFDGIPATPGTWTDTSITCTTPAHAAGAVPVVVTRNDGAVPCTLPSGFTYGVVAVTSVTPNVGPIAGSTPVTIAGTNFGSGPGTVTFDGTPATPGTWTDTSITCTTPAHAVGAVPVVVTRGDGGGFGTLASGFTYSPQFVVVSPTSAVPANVNVNFSVQVWISGITTATLNYKKGGDASYTPIALSQIGMAWNGIIPAVDVTARGLAYYVEVNGASHLYYPTGGASAPANISVHANSGFAFYTTPSGSPNVWNMISPNGDPDDTNMRSVIGAGFGGGGSWIAWGWNQSLNGGAGDWELLPNTPGTFIPGKAWFFAKDGSGMPAFAPFSSTSVDVTGAFDITLQQGWNLVANPYAFPVAWSNTSIIIRYSGNDYTPTQANSSSIVADKLIWWNPATGKYIKRYSNEDPPFTMMPNQGQWLFSAVDGAQMVIKPIYQSPTPINPVTPVTPAPKNDMTAWEVTLSLQSSAGSDSVIAAVGRSTGNVELDQIKSPGTPLTPYIAFTREDQVGAASMLSSDVRTINDKLTWSIKATSSSEVSLNWSLVNVPDDYMLSLEDQTGKVVNLRQDSAIHLGVGVYSFVLKAEKKALIPKATKLLANYPNPFNPETWIPFELSKDTDVAIKIYASNGQLVRSLELGHKMAGFYSSKDKAAYWDGKNETGEQVSSGIYFYNIQAGDYKDIRKMVIMK